jgi:hypothetical protein
MSERGWIVLLAIVCAPAAAAGQDLASLVAGLRDATALITYPLRPDVELCERSVRMGERRIVTRGRGGDCTDGTATVELRVRSGAVTDIQLLEPGEQPTPGATDLGIATATDAAHYFVSLARGSDTRPGVEGAVFAAALADVGGLGLDLLELARDRASSAVVRREALFWLGQDAALAVSDDMTRIAVDEAEDQGVREAAVFALSQRPADESVPALMEIARFAREGETRRSAMFWLAQSDDPRVLGFFEEILLGRR